MRFLTTLCLFFKVIYADSTIYCYDLEQDFLEYKMLGSARLTEETNLNIQGRSQLYFTNWGNIRQEKDHGVVVTQGTVNGVQEVEKVEKHIDSKVLAIDYGNEQILEHTENIVVSSQKKETQGLFHQGQDVIAGVLCHVWLGVSVKKCICKGVVLKQKSEVSSVSYAKQTTKAIFDTNTTMKQSTFPDFTKNKFGLLKDNTKAKKSSVSKNVCNAFRDVIHEVDAKNRSVKSHTDIDNKKNLLTRLLKVFLKRNKRYYLCCL